MIQSLPTTKNQAVNLLESENTYFFHRNFFHSKNQQKKSEK